MAVKIRLQRKGKKRAPFYHIVIADGRSPRDGKFIERIGSYNPMTKPATIELDSDAAFKWLKVGAQPTDTVRAILRFKGVTYRKHLQRGVAKGVITQEEADSKLKTWIDAKEAKTAERREQAKEEVRQFHAKVAGLHLPFKAPEKVVPQVEVKEEAPAVAEEAAPEVAETEAPAEDAPAAEAVEETKPEAPAGEE